MIEAFESWAYVKVTMAWLQLIESLKEGGDIEKWHYFFMQCMGYAFGELETPDFEKNPEFLAYWAHTRIRRVDKENHKPGRIGVVNPNYKAYGKHV